MTEGGGKEVGREMDQPSVICAWINEILKNNEVFQGFLFCIYIDISMEYNTSLINHSSVLSLFLLF